MDLQGSGNVRIRKVYKGLASIVNGLCGITNVRIRKVYKGFHAICKDQEMPKYARFIKDLFRFGMGCAGSEIQEYAMFIKGFIGFAKIWRCGNTKRFIPSSILSRTLISLAFHWWFYISSYII